MQFFPVGSLCVSCPIHNYSDTLFLTCVFVVTSIILHTFDCMKYLSHVLLVLFTHSMSLGMYLSVRLELPTQHFFGYVSFHYIGSYPHNIYLGMYHFVIKIVTQTTFLWTRIFRYIGDYAHTHSVFIRIHFSS
jgi:hypothetical protein